MSIFSDMFDGRIEPKKTVNQFLDYIEDKDLEELIKEAKKIDFIKQNDLLILSILFFSRIENNLLVKRDLRFKIKDAIKKCSEKVDLKDLDLTHIVLRDALLRKKINHKMISFFLMWAEIY